VLLQGNCTLVVEASKDGEEVRVVEGSAETFGGDAAFHRVFLAQEVAGEVAQDCQVLRTVAVADPSLVLAEGHIADPMDAILDPPSTVTQR
jgi:hypothetical protein